MNIDSWEAMTIFTMPYPTTPFIREPTIRRSKRGQRAAEAKKWWVRR